MAAWKIGFDSVSVGRKIWHHCNHQLTMLKISIRKKTSYVWSATTPLAYESIRFSRRSGYFSCYLTEPEATKLAALKSLVSIWEPFLSRSKLNCKKYVVEFKLETICYMWLVLYKSAFDKFGPNKTGYLDPIKCWSWVWPGHFINYLPWKKKNCHRVILDSKLNFQLKNYLVSSFRGANCDRVRFLLNYWTGYLWSYTHLF